MRLIIRGAVHAAADDAGWRWRALLVAPGLSLNGTYFPEEVLRQAVPLFHGVRALVRSDQEHLWDEAVSARNLAGWFEDAAYADGTGVTSLLTLCDDMDWLRLKFLSAWRRDKTDLLGFSLVAHGKGDRAEHLGQWVTMVRSIDEVDFVDVVVRPAAGGRLLAMMEAQQRAWEEDNKTMNRDQLLHLIESKWPWLLASVDLQTATLEQLTQLLADVPPGDARDGSPAAPTLPARALVGPDGYPLHREPPGGGTAVADPPAPQGEASAVALAEAQRTLASLTRMERTMQMRELLSTSELPAPIRSKLETQYTRRLEQGDVWPVEELREAIAAERTALAALRESGLIRGMGADVAGHDVRLGDDQDEQTVQRLIDFFDGKTHSLREAYVQLTGDTKVKGAFARRVRLHDWARVAEAKGITLRESLNSTSFDAVLADVMHKRFIEAYARPDLQLWRQACLIGSVSDFRTQHRTRIGGYANLPVVPEGGPYESLVSPTDEEATFVPAKRGGTEDLTREMILADDANVIRFIPVKLGMAAGQTLLEFVFDFFAANPTIYDAKALYHADHGNLYTDAFGTDTAQFMLHRLAMQSQTELDSGKRLGLVPAMLLGPINLQEAMYNVFRRGTENDARFAQTVAPRVLTPHYWTDTNNWFTLCDPMVCAVVEICFLGGEEEPEILVQDDPRQGAPFTHDKRVYRIDHSYGGVVRDYRGTTAALVA